jgi:hypothetical protein
MDHADWQTPTGQQVGVTLLGTTHFEPSAGDEHDIEVPDVLTQQRQRELEALAEQLAGGEFTSVCVEAPRELQGAVTDQYETARDADLSSPTLFEDTETPIGVRNEIVQIGFRVARAGNHPTVHAVDSRPPVPDDEMTWALDVDPAEASYEVPCPPEIVEAERRRFEAHTIPEFLAYLNAEAQLRRHQTLNTLAALSSTGGNDYTGAAQVGYFYERNARILQNLLRVLDPGERSLLVVGASHVLPLRQLATTHPGLAPISPLDLLAGEPAPVGADEG